MHHGEPQGAFVGDRGNAACDILAAGWCDPETVLQALSLVRSVCILSDPIHVAGPFEVRGQTPTWTLVSCSTVPSTFATKLLWHCSPATGGHPMIERAVARFEVAEVQGVQSIEILPRFMMRGVVAAM